MIGIASQPSIPGCTILGSMYVVQGLLAINAVQPVDTPAGADVTASNDTTFFDSSTGAEATVSIDATYANVTGAGTTTHWVSAGEARGRCRGPDRLLCLI